MEYLFTDEFPASRLDEVVAFLLGPRLWMPSGDYPDFEDWAQRTHTELKAERKRAVAVLSRFMVSGVVIYQRHKELSDTLEIKNVTVRPDERGRRIASFLLRNAEIEGAAAFKSVRAVCDAKIRNLAIGRFLESQGYAISGTADLYGLGAGEDAIYGKTLVAARDGRS